METERPADNTVVVNHTARFSLVADGLLRMEYSPTGQFEDRRSIRALTRPDATAFDKVEEHPDRVVLTGKDLTVTCVTDGKPFSPSNLWASDARTGKVFWKHGQVDNENLGGAHFSLDYMHRRIIPRGVHPATSDLHENSSRWQLWNFGPIMNHAVKEQENAALKKEGLAGRPLHEILALLPDKDLPAELKELLAERAKFPPGILSRAGYFLYNDSGCPVIDPQTNWIRKRDASPDTQDLYLFHYGKDFAGALRNYRLLFGASPMIPRYTLGLWYSRYPTFNEKGLRELVAAFERKNIPLDVLVLDLEWHLRGWHGWDWDTNHIFDPDGFLQYLRRKKIHVTANVHPDSVPVADTRCAEFASEAGIADPGKLSSQGDGRDDLPKLRGFDISVPAHAQAFMDVLHKPVQDQGLDFWWIDGHCPMDEDIGADPQLWTNHVYGEHIRRTYPERRPMVFSRYPGFGAHRYPFHFTADTWAQWEVLKDQVEYTLRAGHMGLSFMTHDIGGHMSPTTFIDPQLYCRWVQFGVLSPVVRLHSSSGGERRPWIYGENVLKSFMASMNLRTALLPYLYTIAWETTQNGMPMCRSCCLATPEWEKGYEIWDSYFLGDRIFATPILTPDMVRNVILPPGTWYSAVDNAIVKSTGTESIPLIARLGDLPPHFYRGGTLMVKQPHGLRAGVLPRELVIEIYCSGGESEDRFVLYEDDGMTQGHENGKSCRTEFAMREGGGAVEVWIGAATGRYRGMPRSRAYRVRVFGREVSRALVDSKDAPVSAVEGRSYSEIRLENRSVGQTCSIRIE